MKKYAPKAESNPSIDAHRQNFVGKVFTLQNYQVVVEDVIAEGGFALVFLVKSTRGEERFALKRMAVNSEQDLAVCHREIHIARCFSSHKNIVSYIDSHVTRVNSEVYEVLLLMQYCPDRLIGQMIERQATGGFSESEVLKVFCDVCEAVAQFHHNQPPIVHRDIKVENVLQSYAGDYELCDFGSAAGVTQNIGNIQQLQDELNRYTTLSYRSPEMVDLYSGKSISTKSDIWALGCFLYRLCFSTLPFGDSAMSIQTGSFTIPDNSPYSHRLHSLIGYMLQVDCDKRPDIYQVSTVAFQLAQRRRCPVPNLHKCGVPDIACLPVPPSETEAKQTAARPALSRRVGATSDIESTSVKPRERPRPGNSSAPRSVVGLEPAPRAVAVKGAIGVEPAPRGTRAVSKEVSAGGSSEPRGVGVVSESASRAVSANDAMQQQQRLKQQELVLQQQQQQQQLQQQAQQEFNALIDLDPGSSLLSDLDPLSRSHVTNNASSSSHTLQHHQASHPPSHPPLQTVPSSSLIDFDSPAASTAWPSLLGQQQVMMRPSVSVWGSVGGPPAGVVGPYCYPASVMAFGVPPRHPVPSHLPLQYQPKTGSNNELNRVQNVGLSQPVNNNAVMKHRRIVSDTSALRAHVTQQQQQQQQQQTFSYIAGPDTRLVNNSAVHPQSQQPQFHAPNQQHFTVDTVSKQMSDLNPFADDNFGSLSAEDIVAKQFEQHRASTNSPNQTLHKRSSSDLLHLNSQPANNSSAAVVSGWR